MKKLLALSIVLLFLVVAVGAAFSAETTFNGQYRVRAWSEWNFDKQAGYGPAYGNNANRAQYDGWFDQRFRLTITHKRSEFLKAVIRLDLVDDTWGQGRGFRINNATGANYVDWAYLDFTLPKIGNFTVGKQPVNFGQGLLLSADAPGLDGIKWANTWGPVTVAAMYLKIDDNVSMGSGSTYYNRDANLFALDLQIAPNDKHLIELFGGYLAANTTYNVGNFSSWWIPSNAGNPDSAWNLGFAGLAYTGNIADMIDIKAEYSWIFGNMEWNTTPVGYDKSASVQGWNLYLDAAYHNDLLRVGLAFVMGSGEKHHWNNASMHNINMTYLHEDNFAFANIIGNGYGGTNSVWGAGAGFGDNAENLTALKLYFEIYPKCCDGKLSLNAAVIWAKWTDPVGTGTRVAADAPAYPFPVNPYSKAGFNSWEASTDLGWEIDFGLKYEIMEGLSYTFSAGVLLPGASFDYVNADGTRESWGPIWSISNTLLYEF
jgi:hypothetical protein